MAKGGERQRLMLQKCNNARKLVITAMVRCCLGYGEG